MWIELIVTAALFILCGMFAFWLGWDARRDVEFNRRHDL